MKRWILTGCLFLICSQLSAQISDWYGVDMSRLGYKSTRFTFENVSTVAMNNPINPESKFGRTEIKGGSIELSADIYKKHLYFSLDGSTLLDVGVTLFQFDREKQRWWDNDDYFVLRSDILPVRLAFGSNIGKYFGLYAGGQYALSSFGLQYKDPSSGYRDTRIGGNVYGFGVHAVAAYKFVNIRYSYMYNWISQASYFKGTSINNELVLSLGWASVGFFAKFNHIFNQSDAGFLPIDRTRLFKSSVENKPFSWQSSHYGTQFQFSVGIYGAGLFSGIMKASTGAIVESETKGATERQEDKRRKVEYK